MRDESNDQEHEHVFIEPSGAPIFIAGISKIPIDDIGLPMIFSCIIGIVLTVVVWSFLDHAITTEFNESVVVLNLFRGNDKPFVRFQKCIGDGDIIAACKETTTENALILYRPNGKYPEDTPVGDAQTSGSLTPLMWVNDFDKLTIDHFPRKETYLILDKRYLVRVGDEYNRDAWRVLVD